MKRFSLFSVTILTLPLLMASSVGYSQMNSNSPGMAKVQANPSSEGGESYDSAVQSSAQPATKPGVTTKQAKMENRPENRVGKHKPSNNNHDIKNGNGKNHRKPNPSGQNSDWNGSTTADSRVMGSPRFDPRSPVRRTFQNFQFLKDNDPELYKLIQSDIEFEKSLRELAKKYKNAKEDKQKEKIRKEIEEQTENHFWVRQQKRELELERMRAWLEQLEGQIKKSRGNSRFIIERRINQLLGNDLGEF